MKSFFSGSDAIMRVYGKEVREKLKAEAGLDEKNIYSKEDILAGKLKDAENMFSTWGAPVLTENEIAEFLPNLKCLFYGAGSVQYFARPYLKRNVRIFSAWGANAVPVAEYTAAQILLANKGFFRTCVFLPCATSLVSYSLIFKSLFATDGLVNTVLCKLGILQTHYNFLGNPTSAKIIIILALIWRWTGYNMVFFLAGLQNIDYSVYEAAKIDGANGWQTFWKITVPLLMPTIVMTAIMSINGTLQLFDESVNLTAGGPANATITMSHYIYNNSMGQGVANFGYASALSFVIFVMVAILSFISMKAGDKRD